MKKLSLVLAIVFMTIGWAFSQRTITGKVTDNTGEALIGASILVKGTSSGTVTDIEGNYSLEVPQGSTTIVLSYTGFSTKEVELGASNVVDVILEESISNLSEVVVVGFGTQVRSNITGNVAQVSGEDIESVPVTSVESALQGRAPGVVISKQNGKTGQGINVRIRGSASINASNEPLYVVDGIVVTSQSQSSLNAATNPLSDINFNDVESIEILKDASAAAIYGSRASNGVVLITTKKGKSGKPQFLLDVSTGFSDPTRNREWLTGPQYNQLWEEAFLRSDFYDETDGTVFGLTAAEWRDRRIPGWDGGNDTDWESEAFNPDAGLTQVQLSVSGGSDNTKYYISGGVLDQTGILIYDEFQRISGRVNVTHSISDKIDLGMNMSLARTVNDRLPNDNSFSTPLQLIALPSVQPLFDPNNPDELFNNTVYFNGKLYEENTSFQSTVYRTLGNVFLNWSPISNLTLHTDFGVDFLSQNEDQFFGTGVSRNTGEPNGFGRSTFTHSLNYSTNNYANYRFSAGASNFDITAGMSFQEFSQSFNSVEGRNFPNDDFQNLASAGEISGGDETGTGFSIVSYFTRLNYNFDSKYLFSLSARIDGDSRFGEDNRYGFFPAVSAGWIISKEDFLADNSTLSYLKLRASYGLTGNTPIENFESRGLFQGNRYAGGSGIRQVQVANPDLKWERTAQLDIGLDFGLFNDRISGQIDYYIKNTTDLLLDVNVPATSGFLSQLQNIGELENKGIELALTTYNLTGAFKWKTTLNFANNDNLITNIQGQVIEGGFINRAVEGSPIGVHFAPEYAGVDPDNGDALFYLNTEQPDGSRDRGTTNNINEAERVIVGDPNPDFTYGFANDFSYKGFTLSIFFQGVSGVDIYNGGGVFQMDGFGWFDNQDTRVLNRWQNPGDVTDIPEVRFLGGASESSRFIEDGSYLRLKTLSFAYDFPRSFVNRISLSSLKLYVTAQNLLTITDYNGWDPEVNADFVAGNIGLGQDFYSAPQAKTVIFGVKVGF